MSEPEASTAERKDEFGDIRSRSFLKMTIALSVIGLLTANTSVHLGILATTMSDALVLKTILYVVAVMALTTHVWKVEWSKAFVAVPIACIATYTIFAFQLQSFGFTFSPIAVLALLIMTMVLYLPTRTLLAAAWSLATR